MNDKFIKMAEKRKERIKQLYAIEEDWTHYSAPCPDHPGVRRYRLGIEDLEKKGYAQTDLAWKCPVDDKIYVGEGSVSEQTKGFSSVNNDRRNEGPIVDDGFDAANKLAKALWSSDLNGQD